MTVSSPEQVGYVHRVDGADHLYFLANISDDARRERVLFRDRTEACRVFATVARAGEKEMREIPFLREQTEAGAALTIPMAAHESCFVVFSPEFAEAQQALELPAHPRRLPLENWTLEIPERKLTFQMEKLRSWEQLPGLSDFSGEGVYRTRFTLEQVPDCAEICLSQLSCACTV